MARRSVRNFFNILTTFSILVAFVISFSGVIVPHQEVSAAAKSNNAADGDNGSNSIGDSDVASSCQGLETETTANINVEATYNGSTVNNGASGSNGQSSNGSLTSYTGSSLRIRMSGTTTPKAANGTVHATITVNGNSVFDSTGTDGGANGVDVTYTYDIASLDSEVITTVVTTACSNVTTIVHHTYPAPENGLDLTCGVSQIVAPGTDAYYPLQAINIPTVFYYQGIDATMDSSPSGPSMADSPVSLPWNTDHLGYARIPTASLTSGQTYTLTFTARSTNPSFPGTATCQANLTVTSLPIPTANITCSTGGPSASACTIAYGASARVIWTSTNTTSCTVSPPDWTGVTGDQSTGALTATTTYTANCTGPGGSVTGSVTVTVQPAPDFAISCSPPARSIAVGSTTSFAITTTTNTGFNSPVTISEKFAPDNGNLPKIEYSNNGAVPNAVTTALVTTEGAALDAYVITFTGTAANGKTHSVDCNLTVTNLAPDAPVNVAVSNNGCGAIDISWDVNKKGAGDTPDGFRVYRRISDKYAWAQLGADIPNTGKDSYSVTDASPINGAGSNYYAVSSYNAGGESELVEPDVTPIVPTSCSGNVSASDKDLIRVQGRINQTFPAVACSGQSESVSMPNNSVFSPGDIVTFQINICNTGKSGVSGIKLHDRMSYVKASATGNPESTTIKGKPCMKEYQISDDLTEIDFTLEDLEAAPPTQVCSITYDAVVSSVDDESVYRLYRFQNFVDMIAEGREYTFSTPPYLFGVNDRDPVRNETSDN